MVRQDHVGRLLLGATRRFDQQLTALLQARGYRDIRPAHAALFAHLDGEGTRPSELAQRAGITKQSMGELIADLEVKGYLVRRPHPSDQRAKLVTLTEAGVELDREATRAIGELERDYRARLGAERFGTLCATLDELRRPVPASTVPFPPQSEDVQRTFPGEAPGSG